MSKLADVSLYIPARNSESTLTACLDAVARLDPAPARVLVVADPRSSDRTLELARGHGAAEVVTQVRPGLTGARNQAYETLETRWVAAVDSDVVVAPDWLGQLAVARKRFPAAVGISARTEERITGVADLWRALMHPHHWGAHPMAGPFMIVSEAIMRREAVLAVGGYRESLARYGDDSRLCRDLRDAGFELAYWPYARGVHVRSDDPASVLDLRWSYGAPRMGDALDDLRGLGGKLDKNVEFARIAVSRGLAAGAPQMALLGALLPVHHALRDLDAMLARRRMPVGRREGAVEALRDAMIACVRSWPALAALAAETLGLGKARPAALRWPAWAPFLADQRARIGRWVLEARAAIGVDVPAVTPADVAGWAARFGGHAHPWAESEHWHTPRPVSPWNVPRHDGFSPRPRQSPAANAPASRVDRHPLFEGRVVTVLSPTPPPRGGVYGALSVHHARSLDELEATPGVVCIPDLGAWTQPQLLLARALERAEGAVVRYRPPANLSRGANDVLMAADIAEACAGAGMVLKSFETIVGDVVIGARRRHVDQLARTG